MRRSYGDLSTSGKSNSHFYPVDFCQWGPWGEAMCLDGNKWDENKDPGRACHGADLYHAFGQGYTRGDFSKAVGDAYGAFFRDGVIPSGQDWSLKTYEGKSRHTL